MRDKSTYEAFAEDPEQKRLLDEEYEQLTNPHIGSNFDDFLRAEGILSEVTERAVKAIYSTDTDDCALKCECGEHVRSNHYFDASFCPKCDIWHNPTCGDESAWPTALRGPRSRAR